MREFDTTTTNSDCEDYKPPMADDPETTLFAHGCSDLKLYWPSTFWGGREHQASIQTQGTWMISRNIEISIWLPRSHKSSLIITSMDHNIFKLHLNKLSTAVMNNSVPIYVLMFNYKMEYDHCKTLSETTVLHIDTNARSVHISETAAFNPKFVMHETVEKWLCVLQIWLYLHALLWVLQWWYKHVFFRGQAHLMYQQR